MKKLLFYFIFILPSLFVNAQTYLLKDDGSSGYDNSAIYQDADGLLGIGAATPSALLHIAGYGVYDIDNPPADLFSVTSILPIGIPPNVTTQTLPYMVVKPDGKVGIGTAEPIAPLHIKGKTWATGNDMGEALQVFEDPDGHILGGFLNENDGTHAPGGAFVILAGNVSNAPSFMIANPQTNHVPFAVLSDGTIATGIDMSVFTPEAQINIAKNNNYDFILKLQNNDQTSEYFNVSNTGHVGIGTTATGSTLTVQETGIGDSRIDVIGTNGSEAIRFIRYGQTPGNYGAHVHHQIIEANNDLVIDPGVADGAHDKLKIDGDVYAMKKLGVGIDVQTEPAIALKAASGGTYLDLFENNATVNGWNGAIRFKNESGNTRHMFIDNYSSTTADNYLVIKPGYDGNATAKLRVEGDEEVTGKLTVNELEITNDLTVHRDAFVDRDLSVTRNETVGGTLGVTGATTLSSTLAVTGAASFASTMYVGGHYPTGSYSGYTLGVYGDLIAKKVIVETGSWSDKVFAADYKLNSLSNLENYITANKHLPEIPSECEVLEKGIDVGEMNKLLLQKVEELTLYVIAQQKQIDALVKK